jgi:hypothetical protein
MTVQGLGFCLFEAFSVGALLPLLYDKVEFEAVAKKLFKVADPIVTTRMCKLLFDYWKADFDPEVLMEWEEWPIHLEVLRMLCCSYIYDRTEVGSPYLQKYPWLRLVWADLLKTDTAFEDRRDTLTELKKKYTWAPVEVAWALSMMIGPERHVVMSQHEEKGPMVLDYTLGEGEEKEADIDETQYHHPPRVEDPSQLPDDTIWLLYHKFEPKNHQQYREKLVSQELTEAGRGYFLKDATYSSANHFDALAPKKLGKCPESPPAWWLEPAKPTDLTALATFSTPRKPNSSSGGSKMDALMDAVHVDLTGDGNTRRGTKRKSSKVVGLGTSNPVDETEKRERAVFQLNATKFRLVQQLKTTAGYLVPAGFVPNTSWYKFLRTSQMLGFDQEDFFLRDNFLTSISASKYTKLARSMFAIGDFVNWGYTPEIADRIGKITIHVEGYTRRHPAPWGELDGGRLTEAEKAVLMDKVVKVAQDSAIGKAIMILCMSGKDLIPESFLDRMAPGSDDEPDPLFPWDVQLNASIGCIPHHTDDAQHDGPGGAVIPVNVNKGAVVVFGKFSQEETEESDSKPAMEHRYLSPASAYGFAGDRLTLWDHGIYPTEYDAAFKTLPNAIEHDAARYVYTLRYGNTAEHVRQAAKKWDEESGSRTHRCYQTNDKEAAAAAAVPATEPKKVKVPKTQKLEPLPVKMLKEQTGMATSASTSAPQVESFVPGGVPRGWTSPMGADLSRSYPGNDGSEITVVEHNALQQQQNGTTLGMLLQRGVAVSVIDNKGTQFQVCILGVYVANRPSEAKKRAFAMIAVREWQQPDWGTPMWSSLARFVGVKCEGCPWQKLLPSGVPAWSNDDMKSAAGALSNSKESSQAAKFWESVVQHDARVSAPQPSHPQSNMSSKHADKQSQSQSPSPSGPALVEPAARIVGNTGGRSTRNSSCSSISTLDQWQGERSAQTGMQAGSVFVNVPPSAPQPPLTEFLAGLSSSMVETWNTANAANTSANAAAALIQQSQSAATNKAMELLAQSHEKRANTADMRAEQAIKANQYLARTMLANQTFQISGLQATMAQALMASIVGAGTAAFAQPQAQLGAPAQPQSTEASISSWLKSKGIAHDDQIVENLIEQGVDAGEDVLLMSQADWKLCGFKPVALTKLAQEKARSG